MRKIITTLLLSLSLAIGWSVAQQRRGIPASPYPITRIQPDGDTLIIRLHGDERKHWATTEDGFVIQENSKGTLCYALLKKDGTVIASRKQAHNADKRTRCEQKYLKRKGIKK